MNSVFKRSITTTLAATGLLVGLSTGTASADDNPPGIKCDYSITTKKMQCDGSSDQVRAPGDVVAAALFSAYNYEGYAVRIWVDQNCKTGATYWFRPDRRWYKNVRSLQAWNQCGVFLVDENGQREGPYTENRPTVGRFGTQTVKIDLE